MDQDKINTTIYELFKQKIQLEIPCYQREYTWKKEQWAKLWIDIISTMKQPNIEGHFMGAIILFDNKKNDNDIKKYWVIDGQQRLTTIYVLLKALYDVAFNEKHDYDICNDIHECLTNATNIQVDSLKIISKEDNQVLQTILLDNNDKHPNKASLFQVYNFFKTEVKNCINTKNTEHYELVQLWNTIKKLIIINEVFDDDGNQDPQVIFEDVNAYHQELSLFNKVCNCILTSDSIKQTEEWYNQYWKPMEDLFSTVFNGFSQSDIEKIEDEYIENFFDFKNITYQKGEKQYDAFRNNLTNELNHANNDEEQKNIRISYLKDLLNYSYFYVLFIYNGEDTNDLSFGAKNYNKFVINHQYDYNWEIRVLLYWFRSLKLTSPYPYFFKLFQLEQAHQISKQTLQKILLLLLRAEVAYIIVNKKKADTTSFYSQLRQNYFQNSSLKDSEINDDNYYQLIFNKLNDSSQNNYESLRIYQNSKLIDELSSSDISISDIQVIKFLFLIMQYQQIIFAQHDNFLGDKLSVFAIFPNEDVDKLLNSSWVNDILDTNSVVKINNDELKKKVKHDLEVLHNRWTNAFGNLAMIDNFKLNKGYKVEHKNGIESFVLKEGEGDFANKKGDLSSSRFQTLYRNILNAKIWNKEAIESQTKFLANLFVECFNNDDNGDK